MAGLAYAVETVTCCYGCMSLRFHVVMVTCFYDYMLLSLQVVETEASREALRKELANLQRKMAEMDDEARLREKDLTLALDDSHRNERKLDDVRRTLEVGYPPWRC